MKCNSGSSALYGIGVLGALLYFIQTATSFIDGVMGVFMALLWPGAVVYKVLEMLKL